MKVRLSCGNGPDRIIDMEPFENQVSERTEDVALAVNSSDEVAEVIAEETLQRENSAGKEERNMQVDYSKKYLLTLEEAAKYTGVGINKLRELSKDEDCPFILWNGCKRLFKRQKLEKYLDEAFSI